MTTNKDRSSGANEMAEQQAPWLGGSDLREGYAEIGDQRLHYVEAGEGPLVVLLHGFTEFWYGWRRQIQPLAAAGFRVVAPDMRGYNLSSRPHDVSAYDTGPLVADIVGLIHERGAESAMLVGHDWGGTVAWDTAMFHPEVVDRLAVLNVAYPRKLSQGLHHPSQLRRSWYFFFFDLPDLPESIVHANRWHFFRHFLYDARPALTPEETERYIQAWSQPRAATGMINYYRSSLRQSQKKAEAALRPIKAPHPSHLGAARSLPRPRPSRAGVRRRAQPGPRRAAAGCLALGPSRRGRAGEPTAHQLLRPRPTRQQPLNLGESSNSARASRPGIARPRGIPALPRCDGWPGSPARRVASRR
jgi:pimeloyl-ACP methyl ester carboxylesterase